MKKIHLILILMLAMVPAVTYAYSSESLNYRVEYKWGMVNKTAGYVNVAINPHGGKYSAKLTAKTAPWADHLYKVRDTLLCTLDKSTLLPEIYERHAHEDKDRTLDVVRYTRNGANVTGTCTRRKWKKGNLSPDESRTLTATGTTMDMLSAFYYMRTLDYGSWKPGQVLTVNIFSGKRKELLTIKYIGIETVKYDKKEYNCFRISFKFTSDGKKKSSEDIDAWISTSGQNIPVKIIGSLPIGKIRCFYTG